MKSLGSQHIHKEIKLQKGMKGIDKILCKTDLIRGKKSLVLEPGTS